MQYYDELATVYDALHSKEQTKKRELVLSLVSKNSGVVLDVGCGSGLSFHNTKTIGIDSSFQMLIEAKKKGLNNLVYGNAEQLPFRDKSFSIVQCISALHNFTDREKAILEMMRVAKGLIIISLFRKARQYNKISSTIQLNLHVIQRIEQEHDTVFVCKI